MLDDLGMLDTFDQHGLRDAVSLLSGRDLFSSGDVFGDLGLLSRVKGSYSEAFCASLSMLSISSELLLTSILSEEIGESLVSLVHSFSLMCVVIRVRQVVLLENLSWLTLYACALGAMASMLSTMLEVLLLTL